MTPSSAIKNSEENKFDIVIAGGGLAGLVSSILLSKSGFKVLLLEKKTYPFNKVCGEYVSNEVLDFLRSLGFDPFLHGASKIDRLRISDTSGNNIFVPLDQGGFGISRFKMDQILSEIAIESGVELKQNTRVGNITFQNEIFSVITPFDEYQSNIVIGSYGKRDLLDKNLSRPFIKNHSRYMGVKYHIKTNYPVNEIGLDNFEGGYCGISKIEDDKYNLCYLYRRNENEFKSIPELEEKVLFKNPFLKNIFLNSEFITANPNVINEIYFENKSCISNHILFCGDSAGLITPLCGNGMAMAIHGAKMLSEILATNYKPGADISPVTRQRIENTYKEKWKNTFSSRLAWGRRLQSFTGNSLLTSISLKCIHFFPAFESWLISKTHGKKI